MNIFQRIAQVFETRLYIDTIFAGLKMTVYITICAAIIGLFLGGIVAIIKVAAEHNKKLKIPSYICDLYLGVIRGTPVALQLFIMVFAIFAIRGFPLEIVAILTFGINSGAYVAENLRAGIQSIDKGQMEAGRSLGISYSGAMISVVLPQAIKNVVPTIGNELIALLKETSIVSMVGLIDLTFAAKIIGSGQNMSDFLAPMLVVGIFYLVIVYAIIICIRLIEKKLGKSDSRNGNNKKRRNIKGIKDSILKSETEKSEAEGQKWQT